MTAPESSGAARPPENLNGVLIVHATLRKGGANLQAAAGRVGEPGVDTATVVKLWEFYARGLRHHHEGEDDVIFPLTAERQPDFRDIESDMRREHDAIDVALEQADAAFAALKASGSAADAERAAEAMGALNETLAAHLAHEEADAIPVVTSVIGDAEMTKIEKGFLKSIRKSDLGLSLAALDATAKTHPELHLPPVPKPALALLALVWRRQYASLLAKAGVGG
jgi:hemerythrin-like domain-containing protein